MIFNSTSLNSRFAQIFFFNDATSQGGDDAHDGRLMQNAACSVITPERPA